MSEVMDKPADVAKKRGVVLVEPRLGLAEAKRQDWVVEADEGTQIDDVLDPMYWAHVAQRFTQYDRIDVRVDTGEWLLELIVVEAGRNFARVHLAARHDLVALGIPSAAIRHKVEYKGTHKKYCVIRIADSALLQEGLPTKEMAAEWMNNHERVTG